MAGVEMNRLVENSVNRVIGGLCFFWMVVGLIIAGVTDWTIVVTPGEQEYSFGGAIFLSAIASLLIGVFVAHPEIITNWLKGK
jgi:hypothetical protein